MNSKNRWLPVSPAKQKSRGSKASGLFDFRFGGGMSNLSTICPEFTGSYRFL
jgi:hypothetical protein